MPGRGRSEPGPRGTGRVACLTSIAETIRQQTEGEPPDIKTVMGRIGELLDESIVPGGYATRPEGSAVIDISKIDFGALAAKLKASKSQKLELEQLKAAIRAQRDRLVRFNPTRADCAEKFEALIDNYNASSRSIDDLFRQLLELTLSLTVEQERHVRESLSEEQLTVFDVPTRPGPDLTTEERDEVKKVARHLLTRLRELLVIQWRDKSQTRARVEEEIKS